MARNAETTMAIDDELFYGVLGVDQAGERQSGDQFDAIVDELQMVGPEMDAPVFYASEARRDEQTKQKVAKVVGALLTESIVSITSPEMVAAEKASLPSVVADYLSGDPERVVAAEARLTADLGTNVFEILDLIGYVSQSYSEHEGDGFYQNRYSLSAMDIHGVMHANHPVEIFRRQIETLNEFRIGDGYRAGLSRTHYFVEESRAPLERDMAVEDADEHGYNTRTWKAMLRLTDIDEFGQRVTESASVCGVDGDGIRRDGIGTQNIRKLLGLAPDADLGDLIIPEAGLEGAYWVSKALLQKRVVSLVELYDAAFDGDTFFGVEGQTGDYDLVAEVSKARRERIAAQMKDKVAELAAALVGASCEEAILIMAHHAKDFAAEVCVADESYDPAQFGEVAAKYIEIARLEIQLGDEVAARRALEMAKATAVVYMCGMRIDMDRVHEDGSPGDSVDVQAIAEQASGNGSNSLKFKCPRGCVNERPPGKFLTHCRKCGTYVGCGMTGPNMIDTSPKSPNVISALWRVADEAGSDRERRIESVDIEARRADRQAEAEAAVEEVFQPMALVSR